MKFFILLAIAIGAVAAAEIFRGKPELDDHWKNFKSKHGKNYSHPVQESTRRKNWEATRTEIEKHNAEAAAGLHTYTMDENHLSDLHDHERQKLTGYLPPRRNSNRQFATFHVDERTVPDAVDSRNDACLPPVGSQGSCSSCWAFSATGPLMYALCKKTGKLVRLSEQQLVDCSTVNHGCSGGGYRAAWEYVKNANGLATLADYNYTAADGTCKFTESMAAGTDTGYVDVEDNEPAIRVAVTNVGAVSASLQVVKSFYSYRTGVYFDSTCSNDGSIATHAVVIVGYGTLYGVDYWIIRNSWGLPWGRRGYGLIQRGVNACNIESNVAYPTV